MEEKIIKEIISDDLKPCSICSKETNKVNIFYECRVCSDECERVWDKRVEEYIANLEDNYE